MIFVAAGTQDGRELAGYLLKMGYEVVASVVSAYGESLLKQYQGIKINCEPLDVAGFVEYFKKHHIEAFVDASHPYAVNASQNAMDACHKAGIPYIRFERPETPLKYDKAHYVDSYEAAAKKAAKLGDSIFLTTGSRNLGVFAKAEALAGKRVICRILPEPGVVEQAISLGFTPASIVAMQGPFSLEMNKAFFQQCNTQVVVTKNSGHTGGADTKFAAAMELGLELVIIDRPKIEYDAEADCNEGVLLLLKKQGI